MTFELGPCLLHSSSSSCNTYPTLELCISVSRESHFSTSVYSNRLVPCLKSRTSNMLQNSSQLSLMKPPGSYHSDLPEHPVDFFIKVINTLDYNSWFSGFSTISSSSEKMVGSLVFVVGLLENRFILN